MNAFAAGFCAAFAIVGFTEDKPDLAIFSLVLAVGNLAIAICRWKYQLSKEQPK